MKKTKSFNVNNFIQGPFTTVFINTAAYRKPKFSESDRTSINILKSEHFPSNLCTTKENKIRYTSFCQESVLKTSGALEGNYHTRGLPLS